ncbi:DNA cytosine methyltransferase [Iodobacter sp. CM08]|uniref:DNA cytosine methyltransferase n=1 Tax=Iodobacter sp. CM08 TaxID=3085902 RepID=UPI00298144C1|nr:DNA cytosine methyltransferase [Iodobacter sp. CM08]MDW5417711.1 DNA cytosine methyltransferase [Iodobacter sp. CM08]
MIRDQFIMDLHHELIVDNFSGGGGASTGIEDGLGRCVDIAINHDPEALAMHSINHPQTKHYCESVWDVKPLEVTQGRPVGLAWFSPDCKHFSKAKGGAPREKKIRGLAWVALRWAAQVKPRVIMLENVEEFKTWGPLLEDGTPCPKNKGRTFNSFVNALKHHGYHVEHRELRACDYGAPTIRKRLFLIARCDGQPIVWPAPTHAAPDSPGVKAGILKPWLTAADCIDWSYACPSIFTRKKPLAEATLRRIARGIKRYVIEAANPYIVTLAHGEGKPGKAQRWGTGVRDINQPLPTVTSSGGYGIVSPVITECANASSPRAWSANEPLRTQCAEVKGGHFALAAATLIKHYGGNYTGDGVDLADPLHTVTTTDHHALLSANLITYYGEKKVGDFRGSSIDAPIATQTTENRHAVVTSNLIKMRGTNIGSATDEPIHTISAQGTHHAEVRAFLVKYYGNEKDGVPLTDPMHTIPCTDRMGLVTVSGQTYAIADIGMRMLEPSELYRAQGFPATYNFAPVINGKPLTKKAQVRMAGNSVCPPLAAALVKANLPELAIWQPKEKRQLLAA